MKATAGFVTSSQTDGESIEISVPHPTFHQFAVWLRSTVLPGRLTSLPDSLRVEKRWQIPLPGEDSCMLPPRSPELRFFPRIVKQSRPSQAPRLSQAPRSAQLQ